MRRKRDADIDEVARRYEQGASDSETVVTDTLAEIGRRLVEREFEKYHSIGLELTAGDADARWQEAEDSGAETPGGHVATPDQDHVDEKWINGRPTASLFNHPGGAVRRQSGQLRLWSHGFKLLNYSWRHIARKRPTGDARAR